MIVTRIADTTIANLADGAPWIAKSATLATAKATHTHHKISGGASRKTSRAGELADADVGGGGGEGQAIRTLGSSSA